ncbi:hypothetical protein MLD38_040664 [Melastoma candidum]|nr:hypothetical protein MLD38_040664 [Melastoma candidum]
MDISQAHHLSSVDSLDELNEVVGDGSLVQQSWRPTLSSLQIPARSVETAFTMVEMPSAATLTPSSNWAGLPPRPNSARLSASVRNLLPQKSYRTKDAGQDIERNCSHHVGTPRLLMKAEVKKHIMRSLSVPANIKSRSLKRMASSGLIRVVPTAPKSEEIGCGTQNDASANDTGEISPVNDVPVRISRKRMLFVGFAWLSSVKVATLSKMELSLPFSCVLGLISSLICFKHGRNYIWGYACFQFVSVILFSHIFYSMLNVNAILSIILASFTGFGIAISTNSLIIEYVKWRLCRQTRPPKPNANLREQGCNRGRRTCRKKQHKYKG